MKFYAEKTKLKLTEPEQAPITAGSAGVFWAEFRFSADWDGMTRTAAFSTGDRVVSVVLDETNRCAVPHEVTAQRGTMFVGVYDTRGEDSVMPTIWSDGISIVTGTGLGDNAQEPTPSVYRQIVTLEQNAVSAAQSVRDDADNGVFDGKSAYASAVEGGYTGTEEEFYAHLASGAGGGSGAPGFSPTVNVTEIEGGRRLTITDVNGTETVDVMDGAKGDKGDTGDTGPVGAQGPKGETGAVGAQGIQGPAGANGITPNLTVGAVTTLNAGSDATVTRRVGSPDTAPIFDFGIPKGADGAGGGSGEQWELLDTINFAENTNVGAFEYTNVGATALFFRFKNVVHPTNNWGGQLMINGMFYSTSGGIFDGTPSGASGWSWIFKIANACVGITGGQTANPENYSFTAAYKPYNPNEQVFAEHDKMETLRFMNRGWTSGEVSIWVKQ